MVAGEGSGSFKIVLMDDELIGDVVGRYRMSLAIEISCLVTLTAFGLAALIFGDALGRGIGLVMLGLAAPVAITTWFKAQKHLYLGTEGLLMTVRGTVVKARCTWDDVAHTWTWVTRMVNQGGSEYGLYDDLGRFTVELRDGRKLRLHRGPFQNLDEIARYVQRQVVPRIERRRTKELDRTGLTQFGPIALTPRGLESGGTFAAWADITRVQCGRVRLKIWTAGSWPVISRQVRTIPDIAVLTTMVTAHRGTRAPGSR